MSERTLDAARLRDDALAYLASPLSRFRPWADPLTGASPQREFILGAGRHRVRIYRGGNRSGKTTAACVDALLRLTGRHPTARHRPPVRGWMSALTWEMGIGQVLWPTMEPWLAKGDVANIVWWRRGKPAVPAAIAFKNGSLLEFKAAAAGRDLYQGAALQFAFADEEHPPDVVEELRARLLSHGGDFSATLTPVLRERWVLDLEREPGSLTVRASMAAAARAGIADQEGVDAYLRSLPDRQRRVRDLGDFAALEGLVYPEWDRDVHLVRPSRGALVDGTGATVAPWPLPASWPRYAAMDFGFSEGHAAAVVLAALDPATGRVFVDRCLYASFVRVTRWVAVLKELLPPLAAPLVCDHDADARAELEANGIRTVAARKEVQPGLEAVSRFLHARRLRVVAAERPSHPVVGPTDTAKVVWEFDGYRYPPARGGVTVGRDVPLKRDDHAMDCVRYLVMALEKAMGGPPAPPAIPGEERRRLGGEALAAPSWIRR